MFSIPLPPLSVRKNKNIIFFFRHRRLLLLQQSSNSRWGGVGCSEDDQGKATRSKHPQPQHFILMILVGCPGRTTAFSSLPPCHGRRWMLDHAPATASATTTCMFKNGRVLPRMMTCTDPDGPGLLEVEDLSRAVIPFLPPERCRLSSPAESLRRGEWFKLICGASFEVRAARHFHQASASTAGNVCCIMIRNIIFPSYLCMLGS